MARKIHIFCNTSGVRLFFIEIYLQLFEREIFIDRAAFSNYFYQVFYVHISCFLYACEQIYK